MLYLNGKDKSPAAAKSNLTLTSVVFEFNCNGGMPVFYNGFNFNKCCIWMQFWQQNLY